MSGMVSQLFGGKSKDQKRAEGAAQAAQLRSIRAGEEERARVAAQAASGRTLRNSGRRTLAFAGSEQGLAPTLAG